MSSPEEGRPRRRRGRPPKAVTQHPADEPANAEMEAETDLLEAAGFEPEASLAGAEQELGEDGDIEQPRPEDLVVQKIRSRLEAARGIDASEVQVEMERGVVVLNGHVASDALRQKIVDSVSASGGVTVIRNRIRLTS